MSLQILSPSHRLNIPLRPQRPQHPFLEALRHVAHGQLTLVTPEGNKLLFDGDQSICAAHLKLYDWQVLDDLMAYGETGFAEAYIKGRWESESLKDLLTFGLVNADTLEGFFHGRPLQALMMQLRHLLRFNSLRGSRRNVMAHYDLGNDFYKLWLDEGMTYSCALFDGDPNRTLEQAQEAKYRRILGKLKARPGQHVLDIGCGWGGFAEIAAREGLRVTAITLSTEQAEFARRRIKYGGLDGMARVEIMDYRNLGGKFDHIVSIGMFEHVGERYWPLYFRTLYDHLKPGGVAMVQSITLDDMLFERLHHTTGFMEQVIFPGGMLPSRSRFRAGAEQAGLECREQFAFGKDYARTAQCWLERFHTQKEAVKALGYDDSFLRLWRFYLSACIASFNCGRTSVMQAELQHA